MLQSVFGSFYVFRLVPQINQTASKRGILRDDRKFFPPSHNCNTQRRAGRGFEETPIQKGLKLFVPRILEAALIEMG